MTTKSVRVAIYARYSSAEQRAESIADQIGLCRKECARQGWTVVTTYSDAAMSGSSSNRPDYERMKVAASHGEFDILLVESVDRLSRRLSEVASLADDLKFRGIRIVTCATGELSTLIIAVLGGVAQNFLEDLKAKTKRGMTGKVMAGLAAGGLGYGYRVVEDSGVRGHRAIIEEEAAVVRRIFGMFASGKSPRAIAAQLNKEHIPGPGGRQWIDTTIRGQVDRGTGLLNNTSYAGETIWNRCSYVVDPRTGKRVARPNPPEQWERFPAPELRIVDDELWAAVKAQQKKVCTVIGRGEAGAALNRSHRAKYLLSGLMKCAECGAQYTMTGRQHYSCSTHLRKGTCSNATTVRRDEMEEIVYSIIRSYMEDEDRIEIVIDHFLSVAKQQPDDRAKDRDRLEAVVANLNRKITNVADALAENGRSDALTRKLAMLESDLAGKQDELAALPSGSAPVPTYDRNFARAVLDTYLAYLPEVFANPYGTEGCHPLTESVREMIDTITIGRDGDGKRRIAITGDIHDVVLASGWQEGDGIKIGHAANKKPSALSAEGLSSLVAGARFELTTFRL